MTFEETLAAISIKKYKGAGQGEIRICCPFCADRGESVDTRFRLGVNTNTRVAHCFNCRWKSSANNTLQIILAKLNHPDAVFEAEEQVEEEEEVVTLPDGFEYLKPNKLKPWYHKKAITYLKDREIPDWQISAKKVGVTIVGRYAYRIIFPVVDKKELIGLVGRAFVKDTEPKYLNSVGTKHLWNCPQDKEIDCMVLSEGIFKALKIERLTMQSSVSMLGHSLSEVQLDQLKQYKYLDRITVWPDPDKVGIKGTIDVCSKLKDKGYKVYTLFPVPKKQADELSDLRVKTYLKNAEKFTWALEQKLRNHASSL